MTTIARPILHCVMVSALHGLFYGFNTGVIGGIATPIVLGIFNGSRVSPGSETDGVWNCTQEPVASPMSRSTLKSLEGLLTANILIGNFLGAFLGPWCAERWGRRKAITIGAAIATACPILIAAIPHYASIVVFRTLLGISLGFACTVGPLYVTEVSPPERRGMLGTLLQVFMCLSIVIGMLVNLVFNPSQKAKCLPDWRWRTQFGVGAVPGFAILLYALVFLPESPKWVAAKSTKKEKLKERRRQRQQQEQEQASESPAAIPELEAQTGWSELFSRPGLKWLIVVVGLPACQQLTGINAIIFYGPTIIGNSGFEDIALLLNVLVIGVWNLLSVFVSFALIDRLGRRPLMLASMGTMFVALLVMGASFHTMPLGDAVLGYLALAMIMLFLLAFEAGPGPLFFVIASELFPASLRNEALALSNGLQSVMNIVISFSFPVLIDALGDPTVSAKGDMLHGSANTFLGMAAIALCCIFFVFFRLPETKETKGSSDQIKSKSDVTSNPKATKMVELGAMDGNKIVASTSNRSEVVSAIIRPISAMANLARTFSAEGRLQEDSSAGRDNHDAEAATTVIADTAISIAQNSSAWTAV